VATQQISCGPNFAFKRDALKRGQRSGQYRVLLQARQHGTSNSKLNTDHQDNRF
jgi:hypothetical protein